MTNVIITNAGVNEIISAGGASSSGPYFPIKYFLLVYDPSFDESIHSVNLGLSTDALPFSANSLSADTNAVQHSGHLIFNIANAYDITDTQFLISGSGIGNTQGYKDVNTISGNAYNHLADINTIYGLPLVSCFSGDGITTSGTGNVGEWYLANAASYLKTANISGSSTSPFLSDKSKYFNVSSYSPIGVPSSDQLRGLFKCRVDNSVGNFVFNKVALFTTSYDESGNESSSNPVLVAMAALNSAVRKTNDGGNIANVEIDVECQFNVNNTTTNISYMSQDYWTRANNATISGGTDTVGLYYNGDVVIGTSGTNWQPSAHLEVTDNVKQQLRLNNVFGDQFVDFNVQSDASMKLSTSGTDQTLVTFFKKDLRVYIGEEIKIVDYEGGALYNENFADFIGQQIFLSGGDYSGTTEAPTTSKGQYIYLTDKVNTSAIGQDIFALRTLNYADNLYGSKIVLSADTDIDASVNSYGLYVSLGNGMNVSDTGFTGKLFAAYFDKGAVQFNDNVYFDGLTYLRDQTILSGSANITFGTGTGVLNVLPIISDDSDSAELRFKDTDCYIKRNSDEDFIVFNNTDIFISGNDNINLMADKSLILNLSGVSRTYSTNGIVSEPSIIFREGNTVNNSVLNNATWTNINTVFYNGVSIVEEYKDNYFYETTGANPFALGVKIKQQGFYEIEIAVENISASQTLTHSYSVGTSSADSLDTYKDDIIIIKDDNKNYSSKVYRRLIKDSTYYPFFKASFAGALNITSNKVRVKYIYLSD